MEDHSARGNHKRFNFWDTVLLTVKFKFNLGIFIFVKRMLKMKFLQENDIEEFEV